MAIRYQDIRNERQWRAATGLTEEQFAQLTNLFQATYEDFFGTSLAQQLERHEDKPKFASYEDLLFYTLYSLKSGLTYDLRALSFDLSRSVAFELQTTGTRLLQMTLHQNQHLPRRQYESYQQIQESIWLSITSCSSTALSSGVNALAISRIRSKTTAPGARRKKKRIRSNVP